MQWRPSDGTTTTHSKHDTAVRRWLLERLQEELTRRRGHHDDVSIATQDAFDHIADDVTRRQEDGVLLVVWKHTDAEIRESCPELAAASSSPINVSAFVRLYSCWRAVNDGKQQEDSDGSRRARAETDAKLFKLFAIEMMAPIYVLVGGGNGSSGDPGQQQQQQQKAVVDVLSQFYPGLRPLERAERMLQDAVRDAEGGYTSRCVIDAKNKLDNAVTVLTATENTRPLAHITEDVERSCLDIMSEMNEQRRRRKPRGPAFPAAASNSRRRREGHLWLTSLAAHELEGVLRRVEQGRLLASASTARRDFVIDVLRSRLQKIVTG